MESFKDISEEISRLLALEGFPVAIKMFRNQSEMEKMEKSVKRSDKNIALCQLISQARYLGWMRLGTAKELTGCKLAAAYLGLMDLPMEYKTGKAYAGSYYTTEEVGKKIFNSIPRVEEKHVAVLVSPLAKCPVKPDVILIFGNACKMLLLLHAYLYDGKEESLNLGSHTGISGCVQAIVPSLKTGKPTIALPCGGFRTFALPSDTDLIFSISYDLIEEILKGLRFLHKGGVRYPHVWKFITVPPDKILSKPIPEYLE